MIRLNRRSFLQSVIGFGSAAAWSVQNAGAAPATPMASPVPSTLPDEDGYELWLRYRPVADAGLLGQYQAATVNIVQLASGPIAQSITDELVLACFAMLGQSPALAKSVTSGGSIVIGTPKSSPAIQGAIDTSRLSSIGNEGFILKSAKIDGHPATVIAANHERGLLYGAFAFIKFMQLRQPIDALDVVDEPRANLRLVNHWDEFDRTVDRGYAGLSIFHFSDLSAPNPRYADYARLLASLGINGSVINNVNASSAFLESGMMAGYASLANIFRSWGVQLYLSVNFASPIDLTANDSSPIKTADPLDSGVQQWWATKVNELYKAVPDLGGFLVKANSEGEPGPLTYNRTHAQGANMLASALAPHGGNVIWRTFVHKGFQGWSEFEFNTFHALDGQFASNVVLQTKNGPMDFQVIEPVNPLFGAMPKTSQAIELQITQEYTGHATHLCYLPMYWSRVLGFKTHVSGDGPTVGEVIDGTAGKQPLTGVAGVINFGDDRNWTGSYLAAANTHGFARLAWDHTLAVQDIATEWTKLTFGVDDTIVSTVVPMLQSSWDTYRQYTSPFGIGYLMRPTGAHFLPDPRATQNLTHFTDSQGSGFDRTLASGSGFTRFYSDYWFDIYEHLDKCPEELLMFMHVVPWNHQLANGKPIVQQMYDFHFQGVDQVQSMQNAWQTLGSRIDRHRFGAISRQFDRHLVQSRTWRDVLLSYYFDHARAISTSHPWVQIQMKSPMFLLGGSTNDVPGMLGNGTGQTQTLQISIDPSHKGWSGKPLKESLKSGETRDVKLSITPPVEPYLAPISFVCDPTTLTTLGFDTHVMLVTPDAKNCSFALDIGTKPDRVAPGYTAITSKDLWSGSSSAGWYGKPPYDIWLGDNWGPLLDHCASGGAPHTLRLQLPAGKQRAWALIGGQGSGSQPVRITDGKHTLVETGYLEESVFQWFGFALDGGANGKTVDLTIEGADGRVWRMSALVVLKPGS